MVTIGFFIILVASNLPPRPVSNIVKSAGFFLKAKNAAAVVISKKVIGLPLFFLLHSSKRDSKNLLDIFLPFKLILSLKLIR